jgi:hypothetical protein
LGGASTLKANFNYREISAIFLAEIVLPTVRFF